MDEEELQKRFTDCVYFLASPLTCKKGIACEYRHSEIARLNPRDCWYWLAGCCFNPDCAFRHPPLEGFKEAYHEPSNLNNSHALPIEKTNIPCYFYSKGFCNKGERCSFLHGPNDSWKPPMVNNPVLCEKKLSAESNTGSTPVVNTHLDQSETPQMENTNIEKKLTQDSHEETSESESSDASEAESQENGTMSKSNSLIQQEYVQSDSDVFNDQSPDEQPGWLESPPLGFDVLVERESERLDADYFSVHDEDEYDPVYPEIGNGFRDVYDHVNDDKVSDQSRKSIFYRLSFKKRVPVFRRGNDLREHLKKRKVVVDNGFSQGYYGPPQIKRHMSRGELRKGVGVRVPVKGKRHGKVMQKKRSFKEESGGVFTGPKTLDQIKEEKKNALEGFQGPRPLSEILKNKRKL